MSSGGHTGHLDDAKQERYLALGIYVRYILRYIRIQAPVQYIRVCIQAPVRVEEVAAISSMGSKSTTSPRPPSCRLGRLPSRPPPSPGGVAPFEQLKIFYLRILVYLVIYDSG